VIPNPHSLARVLYPVAVVRDRESTAPEEGRRARAPQRVLSEAVADLKAEVRDLRAQLAALAEAHQRLQGGTESSRADAGAVVVPPGLPAGPAATVRRLGKRVIRGTLGAARSVWRAADPAQRYVVAPRLSSRPATALPSVTVLAAAAGWPDRDDVYAALAGQTATPFEIAFWDRARGVVQLRGSSGNDVRSAEAHTQDELVAAVQGEILVELPNRYRHLPSTLVEGLQWLLASEQLAYVRVVPGASEEGDRQPSVLMPCARSLWRPGGIDLERLADWAGRRPVVGKTVGLAGRLDAAVPRLAPLGPGSRTVVCRTGRYDVWAGNRTGPVEHRLRPLPPLPPAPSDDVPTVLVVIAAPLAGGTAALVGAALRELRGERRMVVASTASDHAADVHRALALERLGAAVYELGTSLSPEIWPSAIERIASRQPLAAAVVVGSEPWLDPVLDRLRTDGVRLVALPSGGRRPVAAHVRLVADGGSDDGAAASSEDRVAVPAGWLPSQGGPEISEELRGRLRSELGASPDCWLVLTVADLTPAGRPEDVVVVADRLRHRPEIAFAVVGEGPLAGTVLDLAGFLAVDTLALRGPAHRLEELVAAADLVLDPSEEPVVRPVVAAALAAGVPVVTAPGGGAEALVREIGGGVVVTNVGDPDRLADAVRSVRERGLRPDPGRAREVLARQRAKAAAAVRAALVGAAGAVRAE
jgi:glycosyltransferase involved in cell wall biosynthesis